LPNDEAEALALQSLDLDPSWVNSYFVLAQRSEFAGPALGVYLLDVWRRRGQGDVSASRFIAQFVVGDPYRLPPAWLAAAPEPALVLCMSDDLADLDLLVRDRQRTGDKLAFLGRISGPRLMCSARDHRGLPAQKKTIVEDLVKLGKDHRVVIHRGIFSATDRRVAGPAIDTLHLNAVLLDWLGENTAFSEKLRTVCEIGSGSGLLTASLASALGHRDVSFIASDVFGPARRLSQKNLDINLIGQGVAGEGRPSVQIVETPHLLAELDAASVDLLIANPPFIPAFDTGPFDPSAGTELLFDLLAGDGPRILSRHGAIVVLCSSLAIEVLTQALLATKFISFPLGAPRRVPLDVREVVSDPRWLGSLPPSGLVEDWDDPDFTYWHTIQALCLVHEIGAGWQPAARTKLHCFKPSTLNPFKA
jgi:methylase of polypeptide subunit release factors